MKKLSSRISNWPNTLASNDIFDESSLRDVAVFINSLYSKSIRTQNCNIFPDLDMRKLIYRKGYIVEHKGYNHRNGFVLTNIATFKKILSLQEKTEYERR